MTKRIWFCILLFWGSSSLLALELILNSGEIFICDYIAEDEKSVTIDWKGERFRIPKSDIRVLNTKLSGKHISYKYRNFLMKDGSNIKGIVAEEEEASYTLKTDMGFLVVDKKKIQSEEPQDENMSPKKDYQISDPLSGLSEIGLSIGGLANGGDLGKLNPFTQGGGFYVEPKSFYLNPRWQFGYKMEYLVSNGRAKFDFFNNFLYIKYNLKFSERKDFYFVLGAGPSYSRFRYADLSEAGINPAYNLQVGWQGYKFGNYVLRVALVTTVVQEKNHLQPMGGLELGIGYRF